jgi:hypothetical protein
MVDSHSEIAVPGESYFITELLPRVRVYEASGFDTERFVKDVLTLNWTKRPDVPTWIDRWGMDKGMIRKLVLKANPQTYANAVRAVFQCYAEWKGKSIYGDKTPAYIIGIERIAELLPEARFVHLIRDGRDVALAFREAPFGPRTLEEIALHWRARTLAGRKAGSRLGPDRYMELRYEDLVARPEEALTRVCEWLGLAFQPEMLDHRSSVKKLGLGFETAHKSVLKPVERGIRDWRKQMSPNDVERFEIVAGDALDAFGYAGSGRKSSNTAQLVVGMRRAALEGKKLSRRMRGLSSANWW